MHLVTNRGSSFDPARHDPTSLHHFWKGAEFGQPQIPKWRDEKACTSRRGGDCVVSMDRRTFDPNWHEAYALQRFLNAVDAGAIFRGRKRPWQTRAKTMDGELRITASSSWSEGSGWCGWVHCWRQLDAVVQGLTCAPLTLH